MLRVSCVLNCSVILSVPPGSVNIKLIRGLKWVRLGKNAPPLKTEVSSSPLLLVGSNQATPSKRKLFLENRVRARTTRQGVALNLQWCDSAAGWNGEWHGGHQCLVCGDPEATLCMCRPECTSHTL